ncbi:MAG: hypothetical protein OXG56_05815 [Gammaproteobacteria bacterium]|nr:hypothetical protein [Gammaproteobacteria bacterium]
MPTTTLLDEIVEFSRRYGLVVRGGFHPGRDDGIPEIADGVPAGSLVLLGNAGSSLWECFSVSPEYSDGRPDPLDRWSEGVGLELARHFSGRAFFPFGGPPHQPFLEWARKSESLQSSRLGMLIHPEYGLWHAYRFALALRPRIPEFSGKPAGPDICASCVEQPCLQACPVEAFTGTRYDVESCYGYLKSNRESSCRRETCLARAACPEGGAFRYQAEHAGFHTGKYFERLVRRFEN